MRGLISSHRTGMTHWTPSIFMFNPSMALLQLIVLLSAILTCKGFLAFFHINYENGDRFPKQTEQPLSM